jgi:type I restriction-modification system DNA methylase subunit
MAEMPVLNTYFEALKAYRHHDGTEHTLRPALYNLLNALAAQANPKFQVIHEGKRDKDGRGAPDFKFMLNEGIAGYLENKKVEQSLDDTLQTAQVTKYKKLSNNLILTNYWDWLWLRDGKVIARVKFCEASDLGNHKAHLNTDAAAKLEQLVANFLSEPVVGVDKAKKLAEVLARRCRPLRDFLEEALVYQEQHNQKGRLYGLKQTFGQIISGKTAEDDAKKIDAQLLEKLNAEARLKFADTFAQMLGYGLFLAKLNADNKPITLRNAEDYIPATFELIRELVHFLRELEQPEYADIRWLIEEILAIMNTLHLASIKQDLSFNKKLFPADDEERLFAKDPYVYFYEDFLRAYDKQMSKSRGVYYTPPPVVSFIVRAIGDVLKTEFGITEGLADDQRVTVLDFATGTGTFLLEVVHQILDNTPPALHQQLIREHILKNIMGFEYLIAPYTIAHLKLSQFLIDKGYKFQPHERLQIYLTNTLEPTDGQTNLLVPALSEEGRKAQEIKDTPVLVITGNPPYSGISQNMGEWITSLLRGRLVVMDDKHQGDAEKSLKLANYYEVDGQPLGEKKLWLQDDYVKFIRFAQFKMELVDKGVVGIITNHAFLDNPTFRGMRQSLLQTFDKIYVLDLHGNSKKKETAPDGSKDENVFDIEVGTAITLFIRNRAGKVKLAS